MKTRQILLLGTLALSAWASAQTKPETIVPVIDEAPTKAGSYDWLARHKSVVDRVKQGKVDLLMIGDSITHMWGGVPKQPWRDRGDDLWDKYLAPRNAVNLGFGWDRTQHVLWRLQNGEIDGIKPKVAVVMIGTNNLGSNSNEDIALGIKTIVETLKTKFPRIKVLLLGIFPRDEKPDGYLRKQAAEVNTKIAELGKEKRVTYLDLSSIFLQPDGSISADIMPDFLHPSVKGYQLWAEAMEPTLAKLFGDKPIK